MKKIIVAAFVVSLSLGFISCGGAHGDDPGRAYMPDMYYSRAYEAYNYNDVGGERDTLRSRGINYTAMPVAGTVARGDILPYHLTNDSTGLKAADVVRNPLDTLSKNGTVMQEGERLYLVNCGICHGAALDGNGPLYKGGEGPYPVAPRNLMDAYTKALSDGHIYYVMTFGIRSMGSYASQLRPEQRWLVINYIRSKQGGGGAATDSTAANGANNTKASGDTTKKK